MTRDLNTLAEGATAQNEIAPATTRTRRALYNWFAGFGYSILTIVVGVVTTPLLLRFLGSDRFGANRASGEWFGYLMLGDLGVGAAMGVFLLRAYTAADPSLVAATAKFGMKVMAWQAAILAPLATMLAWALPRLVTVPFPLRSELQVAGYISVLGLLVYPLGVFRAVLETQQRGYLVHGAITAQWMTITVLSLLFAFVGFGLPGQAVATLVGYLVFNAVSAWFSKADLRRMASVPAAGISWSSLRQLSWPLAVAGFGNRLSLMTDGIVVAKMLGAQDVARLFLTQRLISLVGGQINGLANATWAGLAELQTVNAALFEDRVNEIIRLIIGAGMIFSGTVAAYNERFIKLWVGSDQYAGAGVTLLTVANSVVFGLVLIFGAMIDVRGDTRQRLRSSLWGGIANLGLSIVLIRRMGLPGVLLGTLVAYLLSDAWYCPLVASRLYHISLSRIGESALRALLTSLPWIALLWMVAHRRTANGGIGFFAAEIFVAGVGSLGYTAFTLLSKRERQQWQARIHSFYASKRKG